MLEAAVVALLAFAGSAVVLLVVEKIIHRLTFNPDKSYRWGVWLFAVLIGIWVFMTNLGRSL